VQPSPQSGVLVTASDNERTMRDRPIRHTAGAAAGSSIGQIDQDVARAPTRDGRRRAGLDRASVMLGRDDVMIFDDVGHSPAFVILSAAGSTPVLRSS